MNNRKEVTRRYRENHHDEIIEYNAQYYLDNYDRIAEYRKANRERQAPYFSMRSREVYLIMEEFGITKKEFRALPPEERARLRKQFREKHPEFATVRERVGE